MKLTFEGSPTEIAALIDGLQGRPTEFKFKIDGKEFFRNTLKDYQKKISREDERDEA